MKYENHPLMKHLAETGESLSSFARRAKTSRMHVYRIMGGDNGVTLDRLHSLSEATGGKVPVSAFLAEEATQ